MDNQFLNKIFNLENKVVVISGACGQLGKAMCEFFNNAGSTVIGLDVQASEGKNAASEYYKLDITKGSEVKGIFQQIFELHGRLDILVNNAGVSTFRPF